MLDRSSKGNSICFLVSIRGAPTSSSLSIERVVEVRCIELQIVGTGEEGSHVCMLTIRGS